MLIYLSYTLMTNEISTEKVLLPNPERKKDAFVDFIFEEKLGVFSSIVENRNKLALALGLPIQIEDVDLLSIPWKEMFDELSFYMQRIINKENIKPQVDRGDDEQVKKILENELQRQWIKAGRSGRAPMQKLWEAYQAYLTLYMKELSVLKEFMNQPNMVDVY